MGFRLNRTYMLKFEGAMEGAEVKLKTTPVSVVMRFMGTVPHDEIAELLAEYVLEWNLDGPDGQPLPIEKAAIVAGMEEVVMAAITREWMKAARGITAPLDARSTSGELSPEASIPMEVS